MCGTATAQRNCEDAFDACTVSRDIALRTALLYEVSADWASYMLEAGEHEHAPHIRAHLRQMSWECAKLSRERCPAAQRQVITPGAEATPWLHSVGALLVDVHDANAEVDCRFTRASWLPVCT